MGEEIVQPTPFFSIFLQGFKTTELLRNLAETYFAFLDLRGGYLKGFEKLGPREPKLEPKLPSHIIFYSSLYKIEGSRLLTNPYLVKNTFCVLRFRA